MFKSVYSYVVIIIIINVQNLNPVRLYKNAMNWCWIVSYQGWNWKTLQPQLLTLMQFWEAKYESVRLSWYIEWLLSVYVNCVQNNFTFEPTFSFALRKPVFQFY